MTLGVGIHSDVPEDLYHQDPAPAPSLSSSVVQKLLAYSAAHAALIHPRIGEGEEEAETEESVKMDVGKAAHAVVLEGVSRIRELDFANFRTNAAKAARDEARAQGLVPLLKDKAAAVRQMVAAIRAQLARHADSSDAFVPGKGKPEQTLIWQEGPIWCRARVDWLPNVPPIVYDLKTVGVSANPDSAGRHLFSQGYDFQAAWYLRGLRKLTGQSWRMRFVCVEVDKPHALSVIEIDEEAVSLADRECERAIRLWGECLAANEWPGYPNETVIVGAPMWRQNHILGVEIREHTAREGGKDLFKSLTRWQAPL